MQPSRVSELALAAGNPGVIDRAADPAAFIVAACERAKTLLRQALEDGQIEQIAEVKSQAEAVRVYIQQKQLGQEAQLAAAEVVRRAERGIGVAIRRGQERGEIRRRGQGGGQPPRAIRPRDDKTMSSPAEFASNSELRGNGAGIYHLTDGVSGADFEAALAVARAEEDLSRSNVVRKLRQRRSLSPEPGEPGVGPGELVPEPDAQRLCPGKAAPVLGGASPAARAARPGLIAEHAKRGMSSRQIADRLGIRDDRVRAIARQHGITIQADAVIGRTRRLDSTRIARETVHALEGLAMGVELANPAEIDPAEAPEWVASVARSLRVLRTFFRQLTEVTTQ
jgi:hypothetical protein